MAVIFAGGMLLAVLQFLFTTYNSIETIPYSQFEQLLEQEKVAEVSVGPDTIQGKLKEPLPSGKSAFVTARVDRALADKLAQKGGERHWRSRERSAAELAVLVLPVVVTIGDHP